MSRLSLPDVTLCAVTSKAIDATSRAVVESCRHIDFGEVLWLGDRKPAGDFACRFVRTAPITSRRDYSQLILNELGRHLTTSHALIVQWDGYVLHPEQWTDAFLAYDYVGAVWPQFDDGHVVGNGGFSLRSTKLMRETARLNDQSGDAEDLLICRRYRTRLETEGSIVFAPVHLARRFSCERERWTDDSFGFHGVFNMPRIMAARDFASLYEQLEPGLVGRIEQVDLLRLALLMRGTTSPALLLPVLKRLKTEKLLITALRKLVPGI